MPQQSSAIGTPVRISFSVYSAKRAREILDHLVEERLVAGGTIVQAESVNWVGGRMQRDVRKIATAYTRLEKLPLIRDRLEMLYGSEVPDISQFVMNGDKKSVLGWIERNVRN